MNDDTRLRGILEIATAILLGLVSVATAAGAYQASEWSRQSGAYAGIAGQLRDESLASNIESQLSSFDDGDRFADALSIELDIMGGSVVDLEAARERQQVLLEAGSPGLAESWTAWVESGYQDDLYPLLAPEFFSAQSAPTYGANRASAVAYEIADAIGARSLLITVASAIFALALLLLGVSGANSSLKVAFGLAVGGAAAFIAGVVISVLAIVG